MLGKGGLVVGLGQCSLDFIGALDEYPGIDQKAELDTLLIQGGGPVATALVTLARLGADTALVGRVGGDDYGTRIRQELLAEGVDCDHLLVDAGGSSQTAFIAVDRHGHRNIFWHRGSAAPLTPAELDPDRIGRAAILHLDGLQFEAALVAAAIARENGVTTVLDGGSWREGTSRLLPLIDHLVVSEKFARQAGSGDPRHVLRELAAFGAHAVTITCGRQGSLSLVDDDIFRMPVFPVDPIDTTGCGDVFHGGYIYGLLRERDMRTVIRFAAACAALKARALGGRTGIPSLAEVEDFLTDHPTCRPEDP